MGHKEVPEDSLAADPQADTETEILTITTIIITTNNNFTRDLDMIMMLLVNWHNWKMPSKNIKSPKLNAKCTLLAKPPKLTAMKPTDLWPNKSMTFSVNSTALKTATNGMIASVVWSKPSNMVQEPTMPVKPMLASH